MHWSMAESAQHTFTTHERDRRWTRLRAAMTAREVDLLLVFPQWVVADALYVASIAGFVAFPLEGEPTLLLGGEDSHRAVQREGWIADRRSATSGGSTRVPYGEAVAAFLRERPVGKRRVAIAGLRGGNYVHVRQPEGYLNYTTVATVLEAMPDAEVVDGTPILGEARYVKSEEEIEALRQSVLAAEASLRALVEHLQPGVPQSDVMLQALAAQARAGAEEPGLAWCPGQWGQTKHRYTTMPSGAVPRPFHLVTEVFPGMRGYDAQIAQAIFLGPVPDEAHALFETTLASFQATCEHMRPGVTWGELEDRVKSVAEGTPFKIEFLMHGRGLGNDGPLIIPTDTHARTQDDPIVANTTFVVKPRAFPGHLDYDPARAHDVAWGDTVVVREDRVERLGTRPMTLLQVP